MVSTRKISARQPPTAPATDPPVPFRPPTRLITYAWKALRPVCSCWFVGATEAATRDIFANVSSRRALRVPLVLSVVVLGCAPQNASHHDAGTGDGPLADAPRDAHTCPIDAPPFDANHGCLQPCGDISGSTDLCHGMEVCVDPCGGCPEGCAPSGFG
jgi:hypothetical protein